MCVCDLIYATTMLGISGYTPGVWSEAVSQVLDVFLSLTWLHTVSQSLFAYDTRRRSTPLLNMLITIPEWEVLTHERI